MLQIRPVRGYLVLLIGAAIFIGLRVALGAPLMPDDSNYAHIAHDAEPQLVVVTALLIGIAIGFSSGLRGVLIATAFSIPPLMIYFTFYPLWIVLCMFLLVPMLAHTALGAWLPAGRAPSK